MPERHSATVHVELLLRDAELTAHAFYAAEGLVHLEEIDRAHRPARAIEDPRDRAAGREQEEVRLARVLALRDHASQRSGAQLARALSRRDDQRRGAVVQLRCVP